MRTPSMLSPMLLIIFSPLGMDLYLPASRAVGTQFGAGLDEVQWTISIFVLALGLGQIPFGNLSDRIGRRPVALAGLVLFGLGSVLGALSRDMTVFLAARALQGVGASMTTVCAFAITRDFHVGDEASNKFSWLTAALNIVPSVAPLIGAGLPAAWGWKSNFAVYAGLAVLVLGFAALKLGETADLGASGAGAGEGAGGSFLADARAVLRVSDSWVPGLICISGLSFIITYLSLAPVVLIKQMGLAPLQFSLLFCLNAVVITLASFVTPRLNARFGVQAMIGNGLALLALAAVLLLLAGHAGMMTTPAAYMVPIALGSAGFAFSFGNAQGVAMTPHGNLIGTASGVLGALQMSVAALVSALIVALGQGQVTLYGAVFTCVFGALILSRQLGARRRGRA